VLCFLLLTEGLVSVAPKGNRGTLVRSGVSGH